MRQATIRKQQIVCLIIVFVAIAICGGAFLTLSVIAKSEFWEASHLQNAQIDISEYGDSIGQNDSTLKDIEDTVSTCNKDAVPMTGSSLSFTKACNEAIIRCFQDVYGVDVSEKLNALQVMRATYPEDISQMVGGSYEGDTPEMSGKLFLNASIVDAFDADIGSGEVPPVTDNTFSAKMLRTIYIHETIHYLGVTGDEVFDHFFEALAESLTPSLPYPAHG